MNVHNPPIEGVLVLLLSFGGCCQDIPPYHVPSPDGKLVASVELQDCSGLDPYYLSVTIRPVGGFVGPFGLGKTVVFSQKDAASVEIDWAGPRDLLIRAKRGGILEHLERWKDVTIHVEERAGW